MNTTADNETCDATSCSLRGAIEAANANPGTDRITFDIPNVSGVPTITVDEATYGNLPAINDPVVIDGTTQGSSPGVEIVAPAPPGSIPMGWYGLDLVSGSITVKGLIFHGFFGQILLDNNGGDTIVGNWLGVDKNGAATHDTDGIDDDTSGGNAIGGLTAADRNVIATQNGFIGNDVSNTTIEGNYFGLTTDGTSSLGQVGQGIFLQGGGGGNTIGGTVPGSANVFATFQSGIALDHSANNVIEGNSIGTNAAETTAIAGDTGITIDGGATGNTIGGTDGAAANVIAGNSGDTGMQVSEGGNTIEGNFVGTNRSRVPYPTHNATGIRQNNDASSTPNAYVGNTIASSSGPDLADGNGIEIDDGAATITGNTIEGNAAAGVDIMASGDGYKISKNSITGNASGIALGSSANTDTKPPSFDSATISGGTVGGQFHYSGDGDLAGVIFDIEIFRSSGTCGSSPQGETYLGTMAGVKLDGNGSTNPPISFSFPAAGSGTAITATATNATDGSTSQFSTCFDASVNSSGGSLAGSLQQDPGGGAPSQFPVDLTSAGTEDWAIWGSANGGTSTSLAPNDRKAGSNEISDLTDIDPAPTAPLRGLGQFNCPSTCPPFLFNWSDGTQSASASDAQGGLQHDGEQTQVVSSVGKGFSFDVPADQTTRTLTVYVVTNRADGQLTASLSDGSAPVFQSPLPAATDERSGIYTITYAAASAGQTLHVQWLETGAYCPSFYCDNAAIYAVALSGGSHTTGATATLSSDNTVQMAGSDDSIAAIPLGAFQSTSGGATPAPINGLPINGLPINGLPINGLPINGLPINGLPINGLPINGLPINGLPINGLPINGLPINGLPINGLPINALQLPGQTWQSILAGTPLANQPLQTITLQQVLALNPLPAALKTLTLGQLSVADSDFGKMSIGALALGATPINGLGLDSSSLSTLVAWCDSVVPAANQAVSCSTATAAPGTLGGQSLFSLTLSEAPINGLPINGLPINGLPINGLPINGLPINGLNLSASPINGLPINGLPINGLVDDRRLHEDRLHGELDEDPR